MDYTILTNSDTCLEIEIRRNSGYNIIVFTGVCALACILTLWSILHEIIKYPYTLNEQKVISLVVLLSAGLYMLKLLFWQLWGKERVTVNENVLTIRKKGTILSVPRRYELYLVFNFLATKKSPYPWWMKIFGIAGGQVEFYYLEAPRYFGQTLDIAQAQEIANLINARISNLYVQN